MPLNIQDNVNLADTVQSGWATDSYGDYQIDGYNAFIQLGTNDGTTGLVVTSSSGAISFATNTVGDGYFARFVGINNINPQASLDVSGKVRTQQLQLTTSVGDGYVLTTDSSGLISASYNSLLGTFPAQTSFDEIVYTGLNVTRYTTWTNSSKTTKIREEIYSYNNLNQVSQATITQYNSLGILVRTMIETYTYSGINISSITRTLS